MNINRPRPGVLQLKQSRTAAGAQLAFYVLFFAIWYSFQVASDRAEGSGALTPYSVLFWVAPLFAVPEIVRQVRFLAAGETFTLNRATGIIDRNGVRRARFSEVARVQIRTLTDPESSNVYRLSLVMKSDEKLRIAQSGKEQDILAAAEDLADILGVEITRKGN